MNVSEYELQDIVECAKHRTKHFWLANIQRSYSDSVTDDPIIDQFKFFTVWPAIVYFYIDNGEVKRTADVVRSRVFDESFKVNPERMILLSVYNRNGQKVIRYAESEYDILT